MLVTGITGFLGEEIARQAHQKGIKIVGIGNSEENIRQTRQKYPEIPLYCLDISQNKNQISRLMEKYKIEYVIHAAAMKHVGLCEKNATRAIEINVVGSQNIIEASLKNNIKNVIGISTDKANSPLCVYGATKHLMEKMLFEENFSVFQGVNFLFSTGSVLDIWEKQRQDKNPIGVNTKNTVRYFIDVRTVAQTILCNLHKKGEYILVDKCYKVHLHDMADAFASYHDFYEREDFIDSGVEKFEEDIPEDIKVVELNKSDLVKYFETHYAQVGE